MAYQPLSSLQDLYKTTNNSMGVQANYPGANTTSTAMTLDPKQQLSSNTSQNANFIASASKISSMPQQTLSQGGVTPSTPYGTSASGQPITNFGTIYDPLTKRTGDEILNSTFSASTKIPLKSYEYSPQVPKTVEETKQLQDYLVSKGYMTKEEVNTGYGTYGPKTTAALTKYLNDTKTQSSNSTANSGNFTQNTGIQTQPTSQQGGNSLVQNTQEINQPVQTGTQTGTKWDQYLQDLTKVKEKYGPAIESKAKELADLKMKQSEQIGGVEQTAGDASLQMGKAGILQNLAAKQQQIKQNELDQLMSAYNAEAGILSTQLGATQPQAGASYYGSPETGTLRGTGSVFQAGAISGQQSMGQQFPQMQAAVSQADAIKSTIQNLLSTTTLNPTDFTDVNKAINFLTGKVGSPQMQTLGNYIGQYIATLAPIIGTDTNAIAQEMVNANARGGSIVDVINNLQSLANAKIQIYQNVGTGSTNQVNIPTSFNTSNILGTSTGEIPTGSSLYNF